MHKFSDDVGTNSSGNGRRQHGFTLIEVLVSLVVLSVGLLGMAKLVMVSSHANDSAYLRSQATAMAYQMIDNMRANLGDSSKGAMAGDYTTALGFMPGLPGKVCNAVTCNNTELAQWDVYAWKQHLKLSMPSGTGSVATSLTFPVTATVIVRWEDSAAQTAVNGVAVGTLAYMDVKLQTVLQ